MHRSPPRSQRLPRACFPSSRAEAECFACTCLRLCAAKKHHPDLNPGDAAAAERFKRMTNAYTQALLISAKREREAASSSGGGASAARGASGGGARFTRTRYGFSSPRTHGGPVDPRHFNVREWDAAHYGIHGETAEERQSQFVRNLYRQQRSRTSRASAAYQTYQASRARVSSGGGLAVVALFAACASIWTAVYKTNVSQRYR